MIPSDPNYVPAATNPNVVNSKLYKHFLSLDIDPYAGHSFDESLVSMIEENASAEFAQQP
jgi:hypothetical protein